MKSATAILCQIDPKYTEKPLFSLVN